MIDIKAAKKLILSEIGARVAPEGFRPKLSEQAFHLPKPFGRWIVHLGFIPDKNFDMDMTVDVAIRVDSVETVVDEWRRKLTAREAEKTATLGGDIGNLGDGRQKRWGITSLEEVGSAIASIYSDVRSIGGGVFRAILEYGESVETVIQHGRSRMVVISWTHCSMQPCCCPGFHIEKVGRD